MEPILQTADYGKGYRTSSAARAVQRRFGKDAGVGQMLGGVQTLGAEEPGTARQKPWLGHGGAPGQQRGPGDTCLPATH